MKNLLLVLILSLFLMCRAGEKSVEKEKKDEEVKMVGLKVFSSSFEDGEIIPDKFTCDGENISPAISWVELPPEVKSLALICDDPDAPGGDFVHWVVYNIPTNINGFKENAEISEIANLGMTDYGRGGYGGPCPPSGVHHYHFKLYALDEMLETESGIDKYKLLEKMEGHILAKGEIVGLYKRKR
jgi:Raf kinase inhibitor-like YbhB/YbcL family protein